jgi:hypothetical protein
MRRTLLCALVALPVVLACAAALDSLEKATGADTVEGPGCEQTKLLHLLHTIRFHCFQRLLSFL